MVKSGQSVLTQVKVMKSLSVNRFQRKLGHVTEAQLKEISTAIALCIGYSDV